MLTLIVLLLIVGAMSRRRWFYRPGFFFRPMGGMFWGNPWMHRRPPMGGFGPGPRMGGFGPMGSTGMGRHGRW